MFKEGEYDYVFDVECGDGIMRKLPFSEGDNIDEASNKFCIKENFSKIHVEQIKEFLYKNTKTRPGQTKNSQHSDSSM